MVDFDEKLAQDQAVDYEIEEPLKDEALEDVTGGRHFARVDTKGNYFCPAGQRMTGSVKGCRSCPHYHETTTHYCSILEKKAKN